MSPRMAAFTITYNRYKKAASDTKTPMNVEIRSGVVENDVIPSKARLKSFL